MNEETHTCVYCGAPATYQLKNGKWCCQPSPNKCPAVRQKNSEGVRSAYSNGAHSPGTKGKPAWNRGRKTGSIRSCPVCGRQFYVPPSSKKVTCSYSCSNKYFHSGDGNGMRRLANDRLISNGEAPPSTYRRLCFEEHGKRCIVCGEDKIVSVHHLTENHSDNSVENLIPLCPTHHQYLHSRYKNEILPKIQEYLDKRR